MLKEWVLSLSLCTILSGSAVAATESWYVISNYTGSIGNYPVHVSLQTYTFGAQTNVKGSYYYDKYRSPIPLYGKETSVGMVLCEVNSDKEYDDYIVEGKKYDLSACPLKLTHGDDALHGTWQSKKAMLNVVLNKTASLDKTSVSHHTENAIDIPFWGQTTTHSFIGVYEMNGDDISISQVRAVNKSSGKVDQVIDPQRHNCHFGFYMTAIYQNIERGGNSSQIALNCYSTGGDVSILYGLNKDQHSYTFIH